MNVQAEADREFWRGMLGMGGFTGIPRWSLDSATGTAEHEAKVSDDLIGALRRLAEELSVTGSSVLLAAHAKVLSALSGERYVGTGYIGGTGPEPLPCRLTTEAESWRELLLAAHRVEAELLSHADFPWEELRGELGLTGGSFETVLDPTGLDSTGLDSTCADGELGVDTVLRLGIAPRGDGLVLRLQYRTEVVDADCAARIAGYHLTALELMAAAPDAEHRGQSLLSVEELDFQVDGLAGRRRELPDAGCMSCLSSGCGPIRAGWPPCAPAAASRMGSSMSARTGWRGPCWRGGWAVRVWWRWLRSAIWIGWPRFWRSSRLVGCICRSSRISRLIALRPCCLGPNADSC